MRFVTFMFLIAATITLQSSTAAHEEPSIENPNKSSFIESMNTLKSKETKCLKQAITKDRMFIPDSQSSIDVCHENQTELRCNTSYPYRLLNGTCNNLQHPLWGSARECFQRLLPAVYEGKSEPRKSVNGQPLPAPRQLSVNIFTDNPVKSHDISAAFIYVGQYFAHDISNFVINPVMLECCSLNASEPQECANQLVAPDDPFYSKYNTTCRPMSRAVPCSACNSDKRQIRNDHTGFFDASITYGTSDEESRHLRANDGTGKLKSNMTHEGELLPNDDIPEDLFCPSEAMPLSNCFRSGDIRVNQHSLLTSMQTTVMREHNRIAEELKKINQHWDEEKLFQEARRIVIAELQNIIYKEYLPIILGKTHMDSMGLSVRPRSSGTKYDPTLRLGCWNEFSAAAFRIIHNMVPTETGLDNVTLTDIYLNPGYIRDGHVESLMEGMCKVNSLKFDRWMVKDVNGFMYRRPFQQVGLDLASIDIIRGRDQGLPPYIDMVKLCSSHTITSFRDLLVHMPLEHIRLLEQNYESVEDVDLYVGLTLERTVPGALVGPTALCIISQQFYLFKYGDRFFFEHEGQVSSFTPAQRKSLKEASISRLLCDNLKLKRLQKNAFRMPSITNLEMPCHLLPKVDLSFWKE